MNLPSLWGLWGKPSVLNSLCYTVHDPDQTKRAHPSATKTTGVEILLFQFFLNTSRELMQPLLSLALPDAAQTPPLFFFRTNTETPFAASSKAAS